MIAPTFKGYVGRSEKPSRRSPRHGGHSGSRATAETRFEIEKSDAEWRRLLTHGAAIRHPARATAPSRHAF